MDNWKYETLNKWFPLPGIYLSLFVKLGPGVLNNDGIMYFCGHEFLWFSYNRYSNNHNGFGS